jgi:hypothetical protein
MGSQFRLLPMSASSSTAYFWSRSVSQLITPNRILATKKGTSIHQTLALLKGIPIAKSRPKTTNSKTATTAPEIHKALGIEPILATTPID